ncbi:MAG TPA: thiamine pyrophosphate-dependent enzyme [Planctomycetota bacterium]|nr:thiamine pyrophosphate-dependent enzyme [Planctomycetota bacterium]
MSGFERRYVDPKDPRPTREQAIERVFAKIPQDALVVCANGHPSREAHRAKDRKGNFYMIGSMGMAPSIALGLALARPQKTVVVLDGDGNVLMGMGTLARVAATQPPKFVHVCLDNGEYGSTGGQKTISTQVKLEEIARGAGYARTMRVHTLDELGAAVALAVAATGPTFILAPVAAGEPRDLAPRVVHEPPAIARRVREAALA